MTGPRDRFFALLRRDIVQPDAADLDFGNDRLPNHRRSTTDHVLQHALPATNPP